MEYSIAPSRRYDYILLKVEGDFTSKSFMKCIIESHTLGNRLGIHNYLVDVIHARNIDSVVGIYEFAHSDMKMAEGLDPLARVAGLISPGDHSHDFVETVSIIAGMSLRLFHDMDSALDYLHIKKTDLTADQDLVI